MSETFDDCVRALLDGPSYTSSHVDRFIEHIRTEGRRESRAAGDFGRQVHFHRSVLPFSWWAGSDTWEQLEFYFVASLDSGEKEAADACLARLASKFSVESHRIRRLYGLRFEALGLWKKAEKVYDELTEVDPTDTFAMKRKIAIAKARGDWRGAVTLINEYLQVFMADTDAWAELSEIYIRLQQYDSALYCYEELIVAFPQNFHHFNRYADLLFTVGRVHDALATFSHSLELMIDNNTAAAFGLLLCISALKRSEQDMFESAAELAETKLCAAYEKATEEHKAILERVLAQLKPTKKN